MAENTREIVLDTLLALEREKGFSHKLMKAVLDKYNYLEERDKAFMKRLTEGTIERTIELDYHLDQYSNVPVHKMKPLIRCLMRMSAYQILYMDSVPDSAACNEAVKLAQKRKFQNLKGFVNGVLRSLSRNKEHLVFPDPVKDRKEYLSVKYSMPLWIVEMWCDSYGEDKTEQILSGLLTVHPVSLRFVTTLPEEEKNKLLEAMSREGVSVTREESLPYLYYVENTENPATLAGFAEGKFVIQDVTSCMAVEAAQISAGDFVIDLCAAPGGKTMLAAEKARQVLSRDVSEAKCAYIEENVARMRLKNVEIQVFDGTTRDETLLEKADVVLADVPCSGLGVIGKKRDIKYHASPEKIADIVELQRQIISASWEYVKKGGVLLYSTCTINAEENEKQVRWILEKFPFELETEQQIFPSEGRGDGFYFARLRRKKDD